MSFLPLPLRGGVVDAVLFIDWFVNKGMTCNEIEETCNSNSASSLCYNDPRFVMHLHK